MAPLRIVGFLPHEAGEGIMLPKDITLLSGSDFDIDKLYIIRPEIVDNYNRRKAIQDWENLSGKKYDTKEIWDDIYATYPEIDLEIERRLEEAYLEWKESTGRNEVTKEQFLKLYSGKLRKLDWLGPNESKNLFEGFLDKYGDEEYAISEGITQSFREWYKENKSKYYLGKIKAYRNRLGRNNIIFDTIYGILTSEHSTDLIFTPGNFDAPKKYGYMAAVLEMYPEFSYEEVDSMSVDLLKKKLQTKKNLVYNHVHLMFHKLNMVAGKLIGVFALNNVSHSVISLIDGQRKQGSNETWIPTIKIDDDNVIYINGNKLSGEVEFDRLYNKDGERISSALAAFLAASVDAVKDPVLNYMNINQTTAGVLSTLVRLGYNTELAMLFLTLPVIKKLIQEYQIINEGAYISMNDLIELTIKDIQKENAESNLSSDITPNINKEYLISTLRNKTALDDINLLKAYLKLNNISYATSAIVLLTKFNSVTSAVGPLISNTVLLEKRVEEARINNMLQTSSMQHALANPIITAFRVNSIEAAHLIFLGMMTLANPEFRELIDKVLEMTKARIKDKLVNRLSDFYMSYLMNLGNPIFDVSEDRRKEIIFNLPKEIKKIKKESTNEFIRRLEVKPADKNHSYLWITINTRGMQSDTRDEIMLAWADLFDTNPELALKLVEYNFNIAGFGFNPKTFTNLIGIKLKLHLPNYIANLNSITNIGDLTNLLDLFFRNNHWDSNLVLNISNSKGIRIEGNRAYVDTNKEFRIEISDGFIKYFVYKGKMYKHTPTNSTKGASLNTKELIYTLVSMLGGNNSEILEINPNGSITTIFREDVYDKSSNLDLRKEKSTNKPFSDLNTNLSQLVAAYLLLNLDETELKEATARLWRGISADKNYSRSSLNSLRSIMTSTGNTLTRTLYAEDVNTSLVIAQALRFLKSKDHATLRLLLNNLNITLDKLNICK